jgi:hypothetical protein
MSDRYEMFNAGALDDAELVVGGSGVWLGDDQISEGEVALLIRSGSQVVVIADRADAIEEALLSAYVKAVTERVTASATVSAVDAEYRDHQKDIALTALNEGIGCSFLVRNDGATAPAAMISGPFADQWGHPDRAWLVYEGPEATQLVLEGHTFDVWWESPKDAQDILEANCILPRCDHCKRPWGSSPNCLRCTYGNGRTRLYTRSGQYAWAGMDHPTEFQFGPDRIQVCDRCNKEWGADPSCPRCWYPEDMGQRPLADPGPLVGSELDGTARKPYPPYLWSEWRKAPGNDLATNLGKPAEPDRDYTFTVTVTCADRDQAEKVMLERMDFEEELGFNYLLRYGAADHHSSQPIYNPANGTWEAVCGDCGETFNPAHELDLVHLDCVVQRP